MKQNVVDVLMYLFENFIGEESFISPESDVVIDKLEQLGFPQHEILKAFDWLEDLAIIQQEPLDDENQAYAFRVFSDLEKELLDPESIGFLIFLEHSGILTPITRELILDRVIALDTHLEIEQLKWIVMIVLYSHPGEENAYAWMESLVFDQIVDYMH